MIEAFGILAVFHVGLGTIGTCRQRANVVCMSILSISWIGATVFIQRGVADGLWQAAAWFSWAFLLAVLQFSHANERWQGVSVGVLVTAAIVHVYSTVMGLDGSNLPLYIDGTGAAFLAGLGVYALIFGKKPRQLAATRIQRMIIVFSSFGHTYVRGHGRRRKTI